MTQSATSGPTSLPIAIGRLVEERRTRIGATRERLAQAGNAYGVTWGRTSIENIEKGRFSPTIQTLYILCRALSALGPPGREGHVSLLDLLPNEGELEVADGFAITSTRMRQFLGDNEAVEFIGENLDELFKTLKGPNPAPTLSEKRAAKKLDIPVDQLKQLAIELWGDPLDIVVSQSAGRDSSPQTRGHTTRHLVNELQNYLEKQNG